MDFFYSDFFKRIEDSKNFNGELYRTKINTRVTDHKAASLFEDCFSNHVNYLNHETTILVAKTDKADRYINQDSLGAYFINKIYTPPQIIDADSNDRNAVIKLDDYISNIAANSFTESSDLFNLGSNTTRYIVGDVGSGKTAFTKKIISELRSRPKLDKEYLIVPVHINLEEKFHYGDEPVPLRSDFIAYLFRRIRSEVISQVPSFDETTTLSINPEIDQVLSIKRLCAELKKQKIRLIIFIDNLDFYHYFYARYAFFPEYYKNQFESVNDNIVWLLMLFKNSEALGNLGLNVIIAVRSYIYFEIACTSNSISTQIDTSRAITLDKVPAEVVVSSRLELLGHAIKAVGMTKKGAESNMLEMLQALRLALFSKDVKDKSFIHKPIGKIYRLGQHGYRSLIHFLSSLSISYIDHELIERFIVRQASSIQILYINNLCRNYSQAQNHFPNLFLNDCTAFASRGFDNAHKPHKHTYWLKYFILKYIVDKKQVKVSELIRVFVTIGKYDDHLVRHVIGSLCTANEFRCAEVIDDETIFKIESRKLRATQRGLTLLEKVFDVEFCFQFHYLETIIDDRWLSLPTNYFDDIYDGKSDYLFLYSTTHEYVNNSIESILSKAKKIIYFLSILKHSFDEEIRKRKTNLDKILVNEKLIPDLDFISNQILNDAEEIIKSILNVKLEDDLNADIRSELDKIKKIRNDLLKDDNLTNKLKQYYDSNVLIGD